MSDIPRSIAIIMDGNRRWAKKRHLPSFFGHDKGARAIEPIVDHAILRGISHLTFWAFSTENWKRSAQEVEELMDVFRKAFNDPSMTRLSDSGARLNVLGDMTPFPKDIQQSVSDLVEKTKNHTKITVNFALNYGGRAEILQAVNVILSEVRPYAIGSPLVGKNPTIADPSAAPQDDIISEEKFASYLYTKGQPDPDLIIRTGGEMRLSGYLPWQGVYSELYFTPTLWPDFDEKALDRALEDYASRQRRFGK